LLFSFGSPTASISHQNDSRRFFFACLNKSRTRDAPTPTNISTKSEPDKEKMVLELHWLRFANNVFQEATKSSF
jgi:hypothetical protein